MNRNDISSEGKKMSYKNVITSSKIVAETSAQSNTNNVQNCKDVNGRNGRDNQFESIIHLKGFAKGIIFKNHQVEVRKAISHLKQFDTIVWDGDLLAKGSFTQLLLHPELSDKKLVAYRKQSGISSFVSSYASNGLLNRCEVRNVPNHLSWQELGSYALQDTGAVSVLTFGGGNTVKAEYEQANNLVNFVVVPITVLNSRTGTVEVTSLLQFIGRNNIKVL